MKVILHQGDITQERVDAIVNAANPWMLGGGGVDGAIHAAAGARLLEACRKVPVVEGTRCPTGEAKITPGFDLPSRFVIHTVGPVYREHSQEEAARLLARAHTESLRLADENGLETVAFPAISCGVYGYPAEEAAQVAVSAVRTYPATSVKEVIFVHFGARTLAAWAAACGE